MHTLASFIFTSLDGFYEGPERRVGLADRRPGVHRLRHSPARRRQTRSRSVAPPTSTWPAYWPTEQAKANDPAMTSRMNNKEKIVFSRTLTDVNWSGSTLFRGEATEQIPTLMAGAGKELLVIGSAHLTANLAQAGILDELRIMICPIVLGQGRSLFEDLKNRVSLSLVRVRRVRFRQPRAHLPTIAPPELNDGARNSADEHDRRLRQSRMSASFPRYGLTLPSR